jgi:hypothetical protein
MENLARCTAIWKGNGYVPLLNLQEIYDEVDGKVKAELEAAGIEVMDLKSDLHRKGEVPTAVIGIVKSWGFRRGFYYYIAEGPGIPPDRAEEFHQKWGQVVRVDGHCGCPSPKKYMGGFAVGLYHIDTIEGLTAFRILLESIGTAKR